MIWEAPFPRELAAAVSGLDYRPGWKFRLEHSERPGGVSGLYLFIGCETKCAYTGSPMVVGFPFAVPPVLKTEEGWTRWLFERIGDAENHERGEWFQVNGQRPYAPQHDPESEAYR